MKKTLIIFLFVFLSLFLIIYFSQIAISFDKLYSDTGKFFLDNNYNDFAISNVVTSIVTQYRGYDTLGEITILFIAVSGLFMLFSSFGNNKKQVLDDSNNVLKYACPILFPLIFLFGAYIMINGHLSPGGGFQGGAIIGSGMLMLFLSNRVKYINHTIAHITESFAVIIILIIGLFGIYYFNSFLINIIPYKGIFGSILSGGIIPIIYTMIGIKVMVEFFHISEYIIRSSDE